MAREQLKQKKVIVTNKMGQNKHKVGKKKRE